MGRSTVRLSRNPGIDFLLAIMLAVLAAAGRALLDMIAPGGAEFILLFPAVILAGVFFGAAPAAAAAVAGWIFTMLVIIGKPLLSWPLLNGAQLDTLLFVPSCGIVLWAIARQRRAATLAAAAEARLLEVFRQIPGAAAILQAPNGTLMLRSAQSEAVLGHPEGQVRESDDLETYGGIHNDGRQYAAEEYPIVRALRTGEIVRGEALVYLRPDKQAVDLEVHAGPVRDPDGNIVAAVGMAFDVTERTAAERRLQQSEARYRATAERLRAAIDAGSLGLWELDLATQTIRLDATFAGMLGLPAEPAEMPRDDLQSLVEPDDRLRARDTLDGAIAAGGVYSDELHMHTVQGAERWILTRGAVLADLRQVVGVVGDVTERRRREEALRAALASRDVLMYEADHRIKNSLQLVVSLLGLQIGRVADPDAKQALGAAISRVEAIANAHLALQRSPDLRSIEIGGMLAELCGQLGSLNPAVTMNCRVDAGLTMDADRAIPLGLLASEVLTNALRHAFPPGVAGEVSLTATPRAGMLELTIVDDGVGLAATPKRRGLGSTLIAALARQIGATVNTHSRPGAGTTVSLRLPLAVVDRAADAAGE